MFFVMKTSFASHPAATTGHSDVIPPVTSNGPGMTRASRELGGDSIPFPDADSALAQELHREGELLAPWLPRFDRLGKLIQDEPGGCPWAGLSDRECAELLRAALAMLPITHRRLFTQSHRDTPEAHAVLRSARTRLAVHQATQAVLSLARHIRTNMSDAVISVRA